MLCVFVCRGFGRGVRSGRERARRRKAAQSSSSPIRGRSSPTPAAAGRDTNPQGGATAEQLPRWLQQSGCAVHFACAEEILNYYYGCREVQAKKEKRGRHLGAPKAPESLATHGLEWASPSAAAIVLAPRGALASKAICMRGCCMPRLGKRLRRCRIRKGPAAGEFHFLSRHRDGVTSSQEQAGLKSKRELQGLEPSQWRKAPHQEGRGARARGARGRAGRSARARALLLRGCTETRRLYNSVA